MAGIAAQFCGREATPRFQNGIHKKPEVLQIRKETDSRGARFDPRPKALPLESERKIPKTGW
jgi:hypothetical protein